MTYCIYRINLKVTHTIIFLIIMESAPLEIIYVQSHLPLALQSPPNANIEGTNPHNKCSLWEDWGDWSGAGASSWEDEPAMKPPFGRSPKLQHNHLSHYCIYTNSSMLVLRCHTPSEGEFIMVRTCQATPGFFLIDKVGLCDKGPKFYAPLAFGLVLPNASWVPCYEEPEWIASIRFK